MRKLLLKFSLNYTQQAGLYAGWELVFRPPTTAAEWKYKVEFKNLSSKLFVLPEPQLGFAIS